MRWLVEDVRQILGLFPEEKALVNYSLTAPGYYYSFFCFLAIGGVFMLASVRIRLVLVRQGILSARAWYVGRWVVMDGVMLLLLGGYIAIGFVPGFSVVLLTSLAVAGYFNLIPPLRTERPLQTER